MKVSATVQAYAERVKKINDQIMAKKAKKEAEAKAEAQSKGKSGTGRRGELG